MSGGVKSVYGMLMRRLIILIHLTAIALFAVTCASAKYITVDEIMLCPAAGEANPPVFDSAQCETAPFWQVDPQGREIWLRAVVDAPDEMISSGTPLGVFVSGKASSEVYLNGRLLGRNGVPAATKDREVPGRMDAVFFAPPDLVRTGENEIVIRLSSHHGFLRFGYPMHWIAFGDYANPTSLIFKEYWPSLIPLGVLIAGGLYFAAASFSGGFRPGVSMLALVSFFAASQLFVEIYRGLHSYPYPAHEWRMILIVLFSLGFGLCLLAHVSAKFLKSRALYGLLAGAAVTLAAVMIIVSYDGKAGLAMLTPAVIGVAISVYAAIQREPQARLYGVALALFAATVFAFPNTFLDALFFYEVAALLLVLFIAQALALTRERKQHEDEQTRSKKLALALERAEQGQAAQTIKVNSAGKLDIISVDDIAHCKGAGDYVEVCLRDGREILHSGSLTQLETSLPETFLRVHRSYLVNTRFVLSLVRESSGTGRLLLTTKAEVPVSRRIMPKVRSALN